MVQVNQNDSSPPVQLLLQYHVLKWGLIIAGPLSWFVALFILLWYPAERKLVGFLLASILGGYYLGLYLLLFKRIKTMLAMDWISAVFMLLPTVVHSWSIYKFPGDDTSGIVVGMLIFASLIFTSNLFFFLFAFVSVWLAAFGCFSAGAELSPSFWLNILFVAPGIAFITRVVVQQNYDLLLERLNSERKLTTELASTEDALKLSRLDQEQSQLDLKQWELQLSTVLSSAPIILCVLDSDGIYTQSRGQGLKKLGLVENEIVGKRFHDLYKTYPGVLAAFEKAQQGKSSQVRVSFSAGLTHEIQYCPVFGKDKALAGVVGVGLDVSESALVERQKLELESQLQQAQKMESLGLLASGVAHDFNNYLGAIIALCDLFGQQTASQTVANGIESNGRLDIPDEIKKIAMNAAGVCEQMLVLAGKSNQEKSVVDLNSLVNEMSQFFRAIVPHEIELSIQLDQHPIYINANPLLIQQSIVNLLKNACEAIKIQGNKGSVLISTRTANGLPTVAFKGIRMGELELLEGQNSFAVLSIKDNGGGIESPDLQRVFEPYFSNKSEGHGFGLAITAGVVRSHSGVIYCDSDSSGTQIDLVFPVSKLKHAAVANPLPAPHFPTNPSKRILLIDDEKMITQSIGMALEGIGHEMKTVSSGAGGLELIDRGEKFDCIIVDFSMPEMNGLEFLKELDERQNGTPAIMCSGYFELPEKGTVLPTATLRKPYSIAQLKETIAKVCSAQRDELVN